MSRQALEVTDLRVEIATARGTARPVDGVSFGVEAGEALGIVGESGSGKSLTLRAILGQLPRRARVTAGEIRIGGRPTDARTRRRGVGMVFQEPRTALNPTMKIGQQIAEGPQSVLGRTAREARARALELMRLVGIPDAVRRADSYPHELSGGMQQRVVIAIALALEPTILLCDEPTTALDVTIQAQILRLLHDLQEDTGVAVVYVSHDLAVIAQTCTRVVVMYAGTFIEEGPVAELFESPKHPYSRALLDAAIEIDRPDHDPDPIPGDLPDPLAWPSGCRFHPRCRYRFPTCSTGAYPLQPAGTGRVTACPHHRRLDLD